MKKITIIGGGVAGLSAGIHAQIAGLSSVIYEKNPLAGGQCMGWNRRNHHIDNCIHWLTGTKKGTDLYKLWETVGALGDEVEMVSHNKFYTSTLGEKSITLWNDLERTKAELLEFAPEDSVEINKFMKFVKLAHCAAPPVKKPMDMMNIFDYVSMGMKMSDLGKVMAEYGKMDMADFADRFTNPLLRKTMSDYIVKDFTVQCFIFSYGAMTSGNGGIPLKGSLEMIHRMIKRYKDLGGSLHTNSSVERILIKDNKAYGVKLADGSVIEADYVICATDVGHTFGALLDASFMNGKMKKLYETPKDYLVYSATQLAFSIDEDAIDSGITFFDCPPFKLANKTISRMSVNSFRYDPYFAPKGKTVLQVSFLQWEEDFSYWKSLDSKGYLKAKLELANTVQKIIQKTFPNTKENIEWLDGWTPITYERYCNSYHGAYMAFMPKKM